MEKTQRIINEESARDLADRLNITYSDYHLLNRALTHRSYLNEHPEALEDNERLEFLGDAVLDFLVGAWLYNRFPEMAEGQLTRLRSALVRTEQLADFSRQLNIAAALRLGRGEIESGGRYRPAILCAAFEAVVGSLYIDGGIKKVKGFVEPLLEKATEAILIRGELHDPKSLLQEWTQARGLGPPHYNTVASSGPDHAKLFNVEVAIEGEVLGLGEGTSKQSAAKAAARAALESLDII
jgi:ribonuclease-3